MCTCTYRLLVWRRLNEADWDGIKETKFYNMYTFRRLFKPDSGRSWSFWQEADLFLIGFFCNLRFSTSSWAVILTFGRCECRMLQCDACPGKHSRKTHWALSPETWSHLVSWNVFLMTTFCHLFFCTFTEPSVRAFPVFFSTTVCLPHLCLHPLVSPKVSLNKRKQQISIRLHTGCCKATFWDFPELIKVKLVLVWSCM